MVSGLWRRIEAGKRVFIIAEAGVNHNGDVRLAKKLVDAACGAGADAVKFQTFKAERLVCAHAPKARYQKETTGAGESQLAMLRRLELSEAGHRQLSAYCRRKNIIFMSTPFDEGCADFLRKLGMGIFKIPSGELTNYPFLRHVAKFGKPMVVSTGMADMREVRRAVAVIRKTGNGQLTLLHCLSSYPAPAEEVNLRAMRTLAEAFKVPVGFSDHTLGADIAIAAAALGARIIEKHLTLDKDMPGPDHRASLEPREFKAMVASIRRVQAAMGDGVKRLARSEKDTAKAARKSLVAASDIPAGAVIASGMITIKRPGTGLAPALKGRVIGRRAKTAIGRDELLRWEHLV